MLMTLYVVQGYNTDIVIRIDNVIAIEADKETGKLYVTWIDFIRGLKVYVALPEVLSIESN